MKAKEIRQRLAEYDDETEFCGRLYPAPTEEQKRDHLLRQRDQLLFAIASVVIFVLVLLHGACAMEYLGIGDWMKAGG